MEENKPQEADSTDTVSETLDEIYTESEQQEVEGERDVQDAKNEFISKEELESIVGRKVENKEDFAKHYKNLASYVGKKVEPKVETPKRDSSNAQIIEKLNRIDFVGDHPEAKEYYEEFILPMSKGQGISLEEAYQKVKPFIEASESQKKEKEIGVESKNRIQSADFQKTNKLVSQARTGDPRAKDDFVREVSLKKFGF